MATNNSSNNQFTNSSDGFDLSGGTTARKLTVTGGDVTITGSGSDVVTLPAATTTLVGRDTTDTLTNKTIDAGDNTITNLDASAVGRLVAAGAGTQITATGNYVITGVGFEPRVIEIFANFDQTSSTTHWNEVSIGFYDRVAGTQGCIVSGAQGTGSGWGTHSESKVIRLEADLGTKQVEGTISATSADGFTLNIATYGVVPTNWRWVAHA